MNLIRVIPILLLKGEGLVKTINFKKATYIGDPINAVRIFNEKEVDELLILDITASVDKRLPNYEWIKDIVSESFMPIGYGGGINHISQIRRLFELGVEKVILNSSSQDFSLIKEASEIFGAQSIVVCIDVKKNIFGDYCVYVNSGTKKIKYSPEEFAQLVVKNGAGEIIVQSIDKEGTMKGYDTTLIKKISNAVNVPIVASGGAGTLLDFKNAIEEGGANAVAAGSLFVFKGVHKAVLINYPDQLTLTNLFQNEK